MALRGCSSSPGQSTRSWRCHPYLAVYRSAARKGRVAELRGRRFGHHSRQYVLVEHADESLTIDLAIWIEGKSFELKNSSRHHIRRKNTAQGLKQLILCFCHLARKCDDACDTAVLDGPWDGSDVFRGRNHTKMNFNLF